MAMYFLLQNPIRWTCENQDEASVAAFDAFLEFLNRTRFDVHMRTAKLLAGSETECAKLYHIYRDEDGQPGVKTVLLAMSEQYQLRPLFDQYKNLIAFGYGYLLNEDGNVTEHFDIQTPQTVYRCKKQKMGWDVQATPNVTGKINVIYYRQPREWEGVQRRIERDEMLDSLAADVNDYFADPVLVVTGDIVSDLPDPKAVGKMVRIQGNEGHLEYLTIPTDSPLKESEKKTLRESIFADSLTPDMDWSQLSGTGTFSGEAMRRALTLGYIKRGINIDLYDELVDREKNLILEIMMRVTHIELRDALSKLKIRHEFAEPFGEDENTRWAAIGRAHTDGIISLETAVRLMAVANPAEEIERIREDKARGNEDFLFPRAK
jgi:hypothetical protein